MTLVILDTLTLCIELLVNMTLLGCGHIGALLYIVASHLKTVLKLFVYQMVEAAYNLQEAGARRVYAEIWTQVNGTLIEKIVASLASLKLSEQYTNLRQPNIASMPPRMQVAAAIVDMMIHAGIIMSIAHLVICLHQDHPRDHPQGRRYRRSGSSLSACRIIAIYYVVACAVLIGSRLELT